MTTDLQDIRAHIHSAFPPGKTPKEALSFNEVCQIFAQDPVFRPVTDWTEITPEDLKIGNIGSLLMMMSEHTFVTWVPAWLVTVAIYKMEAQEALVGFAAACSPRVAFKIGHADLIERRVNRLNPAQRLAVARAGECLAGDSGIIALYEEDLGRSIADAWTKYARDGFSA